MQAHTLKQDSFLCRLCVCVLSLSLSLSLCICAKGKQGKVHVGHRLQSLLGFETALL